MRRLTLIGAALLGLLAALPASAQQLSLGQISNYLNSIDTAKSPFTQVNADGTISTGTLYMDRPGRARFEYNPPEQQLVMANSGTVVILDKKVGGTPETYPLGQTPLSIILSPNVNLNQAGMVKGQSFDGTATTVTAQDPKRPEYGSIQMKFTPNPVELRQWIITDQNGQKTTVILGGLQKVGVPRSLFNIQSEIAKLK